jgi:phosphatidylglycerol---prolipoprotein diacylglyceryl transferase
MNPIAFSIFGLPIRWYGLLIASGMLIGILIAKHTTRAKDISYDTFTDLLLLAIPVGIIGARVYYIIFEFEQYRGNLAAMINVREGGLAIHGGIIFGVLAALVYSKFKRINLIKYLDAAAPSIILAQAIGRWGNFFNQEAHGGPVSQDFMSKFPEFIQKGMFIDGQYYHPTFLYESLWNLGVFIILLLLVNRSRRDGATFFTYIGLYSVGRFFIEGLRTDSLMVGPLRAAQLVSLIGVAIWIIYLLYTYFKNRKSY